MPTHEPGDISESKFLTVAEVAAMMRVSKMTVYRLVHNGDLPAVRVGRSFRVVEKDVNEYLRKRFFNAGCPRRPDRNSSGLPRGRMVVKGPVDSAVRLMHDTVGPSSRRFVGRLKSF